MVDFASLGKSIFMEIAIRLNRLQSGGKSDRVLQGLDQSTLIMFRACLNEVAGESKVFRDKLLKQMEPENVDEVLTDATSDPAWPWNILGEDGPEGPLELIIQGIETTTNDDWRLVAEQFIARQLQKDQNKIGSHG